MKQQRRPHVDQGERTRSRERTNVMLFSFQIGLFAGIIWGAVKAFSFYLKFSKVPASFLAKPFLLPKLYNSAAGFWTGWLFFIGFSIAAAWLYAALFRGIRGPWPGIAYGLVWWALLYLLLGPSMGMMKWIYRLNWNTIVTDFLLFVIWGLFIGYSISFEFTNERDREPSAQTS